MTRKIREKILDMVKKIAGIVRPVMLARYAASAAAAWTLAAGMYLLFENVKIYLESFSRGSEMSVFLKDGVSPARRAEVAGTIGRIGGVSSCTLIDREMALREFSRDPELSGQIGLLAENPLPSWIAVSLDTHEPAKIQKVAEVLKRWPEVDQVRYAQAELAQLDMIFAATMRIRTIAMVVCAAAVTLVCVACALPAVPYYIAALAGVLGGLAGWVAVSYACAVASRAGAWSLRALNSQEVSVMLLAGVLLALVSRLVSPRS